MTAGFRVVPFNPDYDASVFENLDEHLTAYLREGRLQRDLKTGQAAVFLMVDEAGRVQGYSTLTSASVPRQEVFSGTQARKFPYPQVAALYAQLGFIPFRDQPLKLFLRMETIRQLP